MNIEKKERTKEILMGITNKGLVTIIMKNNLKIL
jgi:hypothetical protein